jgi:hypothetical protein
MAFLDNSGDIILDAVLTDTGRYRLAQGNGSFKIAKFALGDDEIDYSLYNKNSPSGSAYYDLNILQSPILEAFTNNGSSLKSKLITISRTNLLYLPVLKLNTNAAKAWSLNSTVGAHLIAVDDETESSFVSAGTLGLVKGANGGGNYIRLDQGLDTTELPSQVPIDADLIETQYIVEMDNRFSSLVKFNAQLADNPAKLSFIDDDSIATYYISLNVNTEYVSTLIVPASNTVSDSDAPCAVSGPRGTKLLFSLRSSIELRNSAYLFEQLGSTTTIDGISVYFIDSTVRITGATTGYRLDVPVRFIKKV